MDDLEKSNLSKRLYELSKTEPVIYFWTTSTSAESLSIAYGFSLPNKKVEKYRTHTVCPRIPISASYGETQIWWTFSKEYLVQFISHLESIRKPKK